MTNLGYIYKITNIVNGKIYVGQTSKTIQYRFKKHISHSKELKNSNILLYRAFRKYGIDNFVISEIEEVTIEELCSKEEFWIKELDCIVPNGYNILSGGFLNNSTNNPFYGKKHTDETRANLSKRASLRVGELNPFYGKKHSDICKLHLSEINKGRTHSDEYKKHMRQLNIDNNPFKGRKHTVEAKTKISTSRCIKNISMLSEDNEIKFETIHDAVSYVKEFNKDSKEKSIRARIRDAIKQKCVAYGFYWVVKK